MLTLTELVASIAVVSLTLFGIRFLAQRLSLPWIPSATVVMMLVGFASATQFPESSLYLGQLDGEFYLTWGRELSEYWSTGNREGVPPHSVWPGSGVWSVIIASLTFLFGDVLLLPITINCGLIGLSTLLIQKSTKNIFGSCNSWAAGVLVATSPAILLNGPTLLREGFFWFGASVTILGLSYAGKGSLKESLILATVGGVVILAIRPNLGVFLTVAVIFVAIFLWLWATRPPTPRRLLWSLSFLLGVLVIFISSVDSLTGKPDLPEYGVIAANELSVSANTGFPAAIPENFFLEEEEDQFSRYLGLVSLAIGNLPRFLFGPFPSEVRSDPVWLFSLAATWHFIVILFLALYAVKTSANGRASSVGLISLAIFCSLLMSATLTNYGIVSRFKIIIELLLIPLAVRGIDTITARFSKRRKA